MSVSSDSKTLKPLHPFHRRYLGALLAAVARTALRRRFKGGARSRHRIKRSNRLPGNYHRHGEARLIDAALWRQVRLEGRWYGQR